MLPQNCHVNSSELSHPSFANTLFDLGDCFGNLCRIPLDSALRLFQTLVSNPLPAASRPLAQQIHTSIPFAVSHEWHNKVWQYQLSLHTDQDNQRHHQVLQQHLAAKTLSSIPDAEKDQLKQWLYFASPLDQLLHLDWQLLSPEQLRQQRLHHLRHWLNDKLQQGRLSGPLLLAPLTDLPFGDGLSHNLSHNLSHSFARVGKLPLPNQQRLGALKYALLVEGKLTQGYGLSPQALFQCHPSQRQPGSAENKSPLLILDQQQCQAYLNQLEQAL